MRVVMMMMMRMRMMMMMIQEAFRLLSDFCWSLLNSLVIEDAPHPPVVEFTCFMNATMRMCSLPVEVLRSNWMVQFPSYKLWSSPFITQLPSIIFEYDDDASDRTPGNQHGLGQWIWGWFMTGPRHGCWKVWSYLVSLFHKPVIIIPGMIYNYSTLVIYQIIIFVLLSIIIFITTIIVIVITIPVINISSLDIQCCGNSFLLQRRCRTDPLNGIPWRGVSHRWVFHRIMAWSPRFWSQRSMKRSNSWRHWDTVQ